jgi:hypothetical protein
MEVPLTWLETLCLCYSVEYEFRTGYYETVFFPDETFVNHNTSPPCFCCFSRQLLANFPVILARLPEPRALPAM